MKMRDCIHDRKCGLHDFFVSQLPMPIGRHGADHVIYLSIDLIMYLALVCSE